MNPRLIFLLIITVMLFTVIGTLSHEMGHALVARNYGRDAVIHYGYTSYTATAEDSLFQDIALRNHTEIRAGSDFPERPRFESMKQRIFREQRNITWGGPGQTMFTGTIGLVLLLSQWRNFKRAERLGSTQWLIVFLTLFWLRQVMNFMIGIGTAALTGSFPRNGDEAQLALHYGLPFWTINAVTFIPAVAVCILAFSALPKSQRGSFLTAMIIGAPAAYFLWFEILGPVLMP